MDVFMTRAKLLFTSACAILTLCILSVCVWISSDGAWRLHQVRSTPLRDLRGATVPAPSSALLRKDFGQLPLNFEPNRGQANGEVKFLSHGSGYTLFLTGDEAVFTTSSQDGPTSPLRMTLV